jgi:hypothetical protein
MIAEPTPRPWHLGEDEADKSSAKQQLSRHLTCAQNPIQAQTQEGFTA